MVIHINKDTIAENESVHYFADTSFGNIRLILPPAKVDIRIGIKKIDKSINKVIIAAGSRNQRIDNQQTQELTNFNESMDVISDGRFWYVVQSQSGIQSGVSILNEIISGEINGVNKIFTLASLPKIDTLSLRLNGLLQNSGLSNDYTISEKTITMINAPIGGSDSDILLGSYLK